MRLVPGTKSLRVNYPFKSKNVVAKTKFWSLRLVLRIQTGLYSWDKSLRPNENILLNLFLFFQLAWRINLVFVCIGSLYRTVALLRFCISNQQCRTLEKKNYRNCKWNTLMDLWMNSVRVYRADLL